MNWKHIKTEILERHEHAIEHDPDDVRLVLAFGNGERVPLVVQHHGSVAIVVAQIATGTASQIMTMLRAATALGIPLVMIGDSVCVRTTIANDNVELALQSTARAALRMRRVSVPARTDLGAFAFAL
jgi:hypothetical protein